MKVKTIIRGNKNSQVKHKRRTDRDTHRVSEREKEKERKREREREEDIERERETERERSKRERSKREREGRERQIEREREREKESNVPCRMSLTPYIASLCGVNSNLHPSSRQLLAFINLP